eukprot:CAMPEP_0180661978 /NCGR_PEP_ID=MMETSP1037_2-20121125/59137_1 /TAXON_ID=632150 /ORGANISM="Azadinium spinosum, Strain 3D9" /LENGTH=119 /DNA_ID=CAMNT_0022689591 /DNA_START=207 /DNA_END=566 /DNA_ORIENTATION=-
MVDHENDHQLPHDAQDQHEVFGPPKDVHGFEVVREFHHTQDLDALEVAKRAGRPQDAPSTRSLVCRPKLTLSNQHEPVCGDQEQIRSHPTPEISSCSQAEAHLHGALGVVPDEEGGAEV